MFTFKFLEGITYRKFKKFSIIKNGLRFEKKTISYFSARKNNSVCNFFMISRDYLTDIKYFTFLDVCFCLVLPIGYQKLVRA